MRAQTFVVLPDEDVAEFAALEVEVRRRAGGMTPGFPCERVPASCNQTLRPPLPDRSRFLARRRIPTLTEWRQVARAEDRRRQGARGAECAEARPARAAASRAAGGGRRRVRRSRGRAPRGARPGRGVAGRARAARRGRGVAPRAGGPDRNRAVPGASRTAGSGLLSFATATAPARSRHCCATAARRWPSSGAR